MFQWKMICRFQIRWLLSFYEFIYEFQLYTIYELQYSSSDTSMLFKDVKVSWRPGISSS